MNDLYTIMTWLGGIGLAILLLVYLPASVMISRGKRADLPGAAEPHGVGGWLLFLLLSNVVWSPLLVIFGFTYLWSVVGRALTGGLIATWFLSIVLFVGGILVYQLIVFGRLIRHRTKHAVARVKQYLTWAWLTWSIPAGLNFIFLGVNIQVSDVKDLVTSAVYCGIVHRYFSVSKRIKNTYTLDTEAECQEGTSKRSTATKAGQSVNVVNPLPEFHPDLASMGSPVATLQASKISIKETDVQRLSQRSFSSDGWSEAKKLAGDDDVAALAMYLRANPPGADSSEHK